MGFFSSASSTCGPQLVHGEMFFFGSLAFMADDSASLADSPLQAQLLPSRGSVHFRADESGALRLQLPARPQIKTLLFSYRKKKKSGCPPPPLSKQAFPDTAGGSHRLGGVGPASHQRAHREERPDNIATAHL